MTIQSFKGEYSFLSNFYPVNITVEGITFPSVEHAYVACKTTDIRVREVISRVDSPGKVKRLGRELVLSDGWDDMKIPVMFGLLVQKFNYPELHRMLKSTLPHDLVEGNWWGDTFWGVCRGVGDNHLGKLLMAIRNT